MSSKYYVKAEIEIKKIRNHLFLTLSVLGFASLVFGCTPQQNTTPITTGSTTPPTVTVTATAGTITGSFIRDITVQYAYELIQKNSENPNFVILDVRTPDEFSVGHIKNAINIDVNAANFEQEVGKLNKNKAYLVYCRSGVRSKQASDNMLKLGFKEIYNMTGGIIAWEAAGYPFVK